jgi:nucleoside-diphosphate-sugar epimerase
VIEGSARVVDLLSGILPGVDLPGLMRPARLLRVDNPYDSSRARQELDWTPIPLAEALQRTAAWLERAGHT